MLVELRIVNFALIEHIQLQCQPGFTVFTGETGAGKSLFIDAVGLLVGGRASVDQIRTGADEATIEASFHLEDDHPIIHTLRTEGTLQPSDADLILKRVISRSGRHRNYLNGSLCPLRLLEALGGNLVDIHGQHEQQSLLSGAKQLEAVDAFGDLQELRSQYEEFHRTWKNSVDRLQMLKNQGTERGRRDELLRFQLQEIEHTAPQRDEEASLQTEYQRLLHASRLREWTEDAHALLHSDDAGALTTLGKVGRLLHEIGQTDPDMKDCGQQLQEAAVTLKDLAGRLRSYADSLEADPQRLDVVAARLDAIRRLGKKYGGSVEAVLSAEERIRAELAMLENLDGQIGELTASCDQAAKQISAVSTQLSKKRREAAVRLTDQVRAELSALKMVQTGFHISMERDDALDACGPTGSDRVEFLLNNNPGEPPRPLGRIASGGELSRIMLSLKTVLSKRDRVPVVIFDEIDTGVGGAVAAVMGIRLRKLGMFHQVFCITHLPQVASQAEHHFLVNKREVGGRATTAIESLDDTGREAEIARMLGGVTITRKVRETAAELIKNSKQKG